jgi:SAM-dependent methyltransferase
MVKVAQDVAEVCRRYSVQWLARWNGKFEGEYCYGFNDDIYIGWVRGQLESRRAPAPGAWLLDAGCGSGEKTKVLARKCPQQNVVGLDLGVESLEKAVAKFGDLPNLDYVQGNVLEAPFKERQFDAGMSLGVLHHTSNTRAAFAKFRRLLKDETTCVIWIYPTYWEGPEWRMPYFARDFITFRQGYRLPTGLLRFVAHAIVIGLYPIVQLFFWKCYRRIGRDLPFFRISDMSIRERYAAQVFYCYDTLLPRYQWRHRIREVESWFVEEGLDPVLHAHSFYTASNVPVQLPAEAPPSKREAVSAV